MAVSDKTAAPWEIPYLAESDIPDMGAGDKAIAERVHAILNASNEQNLNWLKKGTSGQLIVCNSSGVPQYASMSGDATITAAGDLELGAGVVGTTELAGTSVTSAKLAAGAALANLADESVPGSKLEASARPVTWYAPKVIATEQSRTLSSFGKLSTADEISGIEVPSGGLLAIRYSALVSVGSSFPGAVALFINAQQLKAGSGLASQELEISSNGFSAILTAGSGGLISQGEVSSLPTTGYGMGVTEVVVPAGTYAVSVQYKTHSGTSQTITAKNRTLWVSVAGF